MGRDVDKPSYRPFGVAVATWYSYKAPTMSRSMAAVQDHGPPTGGLQRHHSLNHNITGLAKCSPEKQTSIHWTVEALARIVLSVVNCIEGGFSQIQYTHTHTYILCILHAHSIYVYIHIHIIIFFIVDIR